MASKIFKVINHGLTILLFTIFIVLLFTIISTRASGGEASLFGYQIKTVLSGSMEPEMQTGSIITVKKTTPDHHFKKNDIITFETNDNVIVTHRISNIQENGESYITKGDANNAEDTEPVLQENIIGLYTGTSIPYLGYILNFIHSSNGAALLLLIPGIGFLIYSILSIGKAFRSINAT